MSKYNLLASLMWNILGIGSFFVYMSNKDSNFMIVAILGLILSRLYDMGEI